MKLKRRIKNLEEVGEAHRGLYTKDETAGDYVLDVQVEGMVEKTQLEEFRNNNVQLKRDMEALQAQLGELGDLDEVKNLVAERRKNGEKKLIEEGKVDELVQQRTETMRKNYEAQIKQLQGSLDTEQQKSKQYYAQLSHTLIDADLTKAISEVGVPVKGSMQDILARGRAVWTLEEGKLVAKENDVALYGKDGKAPLTPVEWAQSLYQTAPFLFEASKGGGGNGSGPTKTPAGVQVIANDPVAIGQNLEAIATGKATVQS